MTDREAAIGPAVRVGTVRVDAAASAAGADLARRLPAALARALGEAALSGQLPAAHLAQLRIEVAGDTSPAAIAQAIRRALRRPGK